MKYLVKEDNEIICTCDTKEQAEYITTLLEGVYGNTEGLPCWRAPKGPEYTIEQVVDSPAI